MELYVIAAITAGVHFGFKYYDYFKSKTKITQPFKLTENLLGTVLSIVCASLLLYEKNIITVIFGAAPTIYTAMILGYTADSLFKNVISKAKK